MVASASTEDLDLAGQPMRRRVILVNPKMCSPRAVRLPLSLLALAAVLDEAYQVEIVDGNLDPHAAATVIDLASSRPEVAAVGVTVMPGPQVRPAIDLSSSVRAAQPDIPIVWGGFFPTLYPDAAINAPYVDFVVRGQGERTLLELLKRLPDAGPPPVAGQGGAMSSVTDPGAVADLRGLTWMHRGEIIHSPDREFSPPDGFPPFPYDDLRDVDAYLRPSFLGSRTAVHQAAIGCRVPLRLLRRRIDVQRTHDASGSRPSRTRHETLRADSEPTRCSSTITTSSTGKRPASTSLSDRSLRHVPGGATRRTDTLANFSTATWELDPLERSADDLHGRRSRQRRCLKSMKKGARVEHTFEVVGTVSRDRRHPRVLLRARRSRRPRGGDREHLRSYQTPQERSTRSARSSSTSTARRRSAIEPCSIHTSTPRVPGLQTYGPNGPTLPTTPEEWTEPRWIDYVCHQDAPWLTPEIRQRVKDFSKVLYCRFPTVQDTVTPSWGKSLLRGLAGWRYASGRYGRPWELDLARRVLRPREPQRESI